MKLKKIISSFLIISLFNGNCIISSCANADTLDKYEVLEGEYITIHDSEKDSIEEIDIFGNTVQNSESLSDIQSVGDLYVDNNGEPILDKQGRKQYKLELVSQNKNLFDKNNEWSVCTYAGGWVENEDLIFYEFQDSKVIVKNQRLNRDVLGYKLKVFGSQPVTVSIKDIGYTSLLYYSCYSKDWEYTKKQTTKSAQKIGERSVYSLKASDIPEGTDYVLLGIGNPNLVNYEIEDIMIEYGDYTGDYIVCENKKIELLMPTQLCKVGNISDRLYWDNSKNKYIIEKNIKQVALDGSANWIDCGHDIDNTMYFQRAAIDIVGTWGNPYLISDTLKAYDNLSLLYNSPEGICTGGPNGVRIEIRVSKSRLNSPDVSGLKSWLKANPISVYYASDQSTLIDTNITSKLKLPTYEEKTHIYIDLNNRINPTLKIKVDILNKKAKENVLKAQNSGLLQDIAVARMYVNTLEESLYKDQLQEQLNEIFSNEMALDKKVVSSNMDLYVKSANMLSMSLSTNSVTFENFTGIEDMEMLSAVDIMVNSSLPYNLNVYMPDGIYNKDKTKTLDIKTLNIKESTQNNYQNFTSNSDKIVLNDKGQSGNDKIHSIDLKLSGSDAHKADVYKTVLKFEVQQK